MCYYYYYYERGILDLVKLRRLREISIFVAACDLCEHLQSAFASTFIWGPAKSLRLLRAYNSAFHHEPNPVIMAMLDLNTRTHA